MNNIVFQYYPAQVKSNRPIGAVKLIDFINAHKSPKPHVIDIFKQIERAEIKNDIKTKAELKQNNLFYFTPCVLVSPFRRYSDIKLFTGLAVLDFDHIENAPELKNYLFENYNYIIAAWLSPSRFGVKCLVKIPIATDIDKFKSHWFALRKEFEVFDGWDDTTKNAVLPLFQSFDTELLYRESPTTFNKTAENPNKFDKEKSNYRVDTVKQTNIIYKIADSAILKISAPGHPQLRSACIALGGYVASGYIDYAQIISHIYYLIESNSYLQKGVDGYKKTALWAVNEGLKKPIKLN